MPNLKTMLSNKINRLSAGGDGVYGRDIIIGSVTGGKSIKKAEREANQIKREYFRFDDSEVDGEHVCGS